MFEYITSLILPLIGTVGVIILTYYASKWYANKMGPASGSRNMKVLEKLPLSKTGSILIMEVEDKQYLIGVTDHSIQIMKELETPITLRDRQDKDEKAMLNFKEIMKNLTHRDGTDETK